MGGFGGLLHLPEGVRQTLEQSGVRAALEALYLTA
jgi:hypothetical protein